MSRRVLIFSSLMVLFLWVGIYQLVIKPKNVNLEQAYSAKCSFCVNPEDVTKITIAGRLVVVKTKSGWRVNGKVPLSYALRGFLQGLLTTAADEVFTLADVSEQLGDRRKSLTIETKEGANNFEVAERLAPDGRRYLIWKAKKQAFLMPLIWSSVLQLPESQLTEPEINTEAGGKENP